MKSAILESVQQSDGRYLDDVELRPFAQFVTTFDKRLKVYLWIKDEEEKLTLKALRQLMQTNHRKTVQEHGAICQRDMRYTLQFIGKAILQDSPEGFMEEYVVWMQNIMRAFQKQNSVVETYRLLQTEISAALPADEAALINGYLDTLAQAVADGI
ncbi:MAG: hypothetical protein ACFCVD_14065 [Nodosilinea sp.]